jgi:hypothetical protein
MMSELDVADPNRDPGPSDTNSSPVDPGRIQVINDSSQRVRLNDREIIASGTLHCRGETIQIVPFPRYPTGPRIEFVFFDACKSDPTAKVWLGEQPGSAKMRKRTRSFGYPHICLNWNLRPTLVFEPYEVATYRGRKIMADISYDRLETGPSPRRRFYYTLYYATPRKCE